VLYPVELLARFRFSMLPSSEIPQRSCVD